jgi:hypothetical protein
MNTSQLLNQVLTTGGATVKPNLKPYTGKGYAVAISKRYEKIIPLDGDSGALQGLFNEALTDLRFAAASRGAYIGAWIDQGKLYLDLSEVMDSKAKAIDLGLKRGQLGIFSFETGLTIDLRTGKVA